MGLELFSKESCQSSHQDWLLWFNTSIFVGSSGRSASWRPTNHQKTTCTSNVDSTSIQQRSKQSASASKQEIVHRTLSFNVSQDFGVSKITAAKLRSTYKQSFIFPQTDATPKIINGNLDTTHMYCT